MKLENKVVVVTGSTRGIGRAIAEGCAAEGARVVVSSRRELAVEETVAALREQGFEASGIAADVSSPGDVESLLRHAVETWGGVDVWVNNAGLSGGLRYLDELAPQEIADIVSVNVTGVLLACRIVIPLMIERGGGIVLNLGGKGGRGEASPFLTVYAATKAAVTSLTKSLAGEYKGQPVSIHAVIPGMVKTAFYDEMPTSPRLAEMAKNTPLALEAFGVPIDEVGRASARIAAQEPGKVTGKVYSLLGGRRLLRGIGMMTWRRLTGRLSPSRRNST